MVLKKRKTQSFKERMGKVFFSSHGLPIFLTLTMIAIMFVVFRMQGVELDYKVIYAEKEIQKLQLENKELKAQRARMLSVKRLRAMASRYDLGQPRTKQVIVIPN